MSVFGADEQRRRLAEALRRLRVTSGLTGGQLGEAVGVSQSVISRMENGRQRVSIQQVRLWCKATGAPEHILAELLQLAEDVLVGPTGWGVSPLSGTSDHQGEVAELEARAGRVWNYQPGGLPGLLQTAATARRTYETSPVPLPDVDDRVLRRLDRQRILYDPARQHSFMIPETVLRWPLGPPDEHLEQLDRVRNVIGLPGVEVGLLPMRPGRAWRLGGFIIYSEIAGGDPFVHLETLTLPVNVSEPDQVDMYRLAYERLRADAVFDEEARALLGQVTDDFRRQL